MIPRKTCKESYSHDEDDVEDTANESTSHLIFSIHPKSNLNFENNIPFVGISFFFMFSVCLYFSISLHFRREAIIETDYHKTIDNTYEARLKRLKEELNRPTVTEIIQMHKSQGMNEKPSELPINSNVMHPHSNAMPLETKTLENDRY